MKAIFLETPLPKKPTVYVLDKILPYEARTDILFIFWAMEFQEKYAFEICWLLKREKTVLTWAYSVLFWSRLVTDFVCQSISIFFIVLGIYNFADFVVAFAKGIGV